MAIKPTAHFAIRAHYLACGRPAAGTGPFCLCRGQNFSGKIPAAERLSTSLPSSAQPSHSPLAGGRLPQFLRNLYHGIETVVPGEHLA